MTGIESYVYELYIHDDINWLPRNNALVLSSLQLAEDEGENEMEKVIQDVEEYSKKMDDLNSKL